MVIFPLVSESKVVKGTYCNGIIDVVTIDE